jgi:flavin reductase (DIM6/NTAB) family NADH-FMN oxidoreductase RutF
MVDEQLLEKMHFSSKELPEEISEAEEFNILTQHIVDNFPPIIKGVKSAFFCEFYQELELKGSKTIPLVVQIKEQYISDDIIVDKERLVLDYEPVARVGKSYALLGKKINPPIIK